MEPQLDGSFGGSITAIGLTANNYVVGNTGYFDVLDAGGFRKPILVL